MYSISFIGAGNVAFRLSLALQHAGHRVECICNRNQEKAEQIVRALKRHKGTAFATTSHAEIPQSDLIILAVSDQAIAETAQALTGRHNSLIVHTSGAESVTVLQQAGIQHYGVLYPLMTLSKNKDLDVRMIPFLLEASGKEQEKKLTTLVDTLRAEYKLCDSQKRLQMHTAAVFSTNFINYLLGLSYEISYPDFTFLLPCAIETVRKAFLNKPAVSQTGPAVRGDFRTLEKHLTLLQEKGLQEQYDVYKMLTAHLAARYNTQQNKPTENE